MSIIVQLSSFGEFLNKKFKSFYWNTSIRMVPAYVNILINDFINFGKNRDVTISDKMTLVQFNIIGEIKIVLYSENFVINMRIFRLNRTNIEI